MARACARPRGDVERSETGAREKMVEVRGETANRNPRVGLVGGEGRLVDKAATAARAFARPRGDVERSETGASEKMVEVRGETANRNQRVGLAGGNPQTGMVEPRGVEPLTSTMPL